MAGTDAPHDTGTIVLVDGFGLIFRAYYALPPSIATAEGEQTNAVFGFASMLLDVLRQREPDYAVIALESGHTFRHEMYPDYKGTRAEMPEDLRGQIDRVLELIDALNIPIQKKDLYEADDIIGTLSRKLADEGHNVIIITGDSDLLQLVDDNILVVLPGTRRFGDVREYDPAAVIERYGFGPEFVPDYKALVGDTSDNIPGVPGIGDKTAKKLIAEFGPLEEIIAHVDDVTPTRARNALSANIEQARKSKELATIVRNVDLDFDLNTAHVHDFDRETITDLFRTLEFRSLLNKLPVPHNDLGGAIEAKVESVPSEQTIVRTDHQLDALIADIKTTGEITVDVETTGTDPFLAELVGIAIATTPSRSYYIPVGHENGEQLDADHVREKLDPVIANPELKVYTHHGKYDYHVLIRHGYTPHSIDFDTMIAAYLLGENSLRLKDLSFNRLGIEQTEITELIGTGRKQVTMDKVDIDLAAPYACADVECTFGLVAPLRADLEKREQMPLLTNMELPLASILIDMERAGIAIDPEELTEFSVELGERILAIDAEVDVLAGRPISIASNKQIGTLLFEELGLPPGRKTKTGYSVDSEVLENLRNEHEIITLILEHRMLSKLKSTYVDALPTFVNPVDQRVHSSFNQTVAATGRLSSNNPNLQNIPIRTEMGRRVRRAFIADHRPEYRIQDNAILVGADYSQMELRILAHMSGDPALVDAFNAGEDIHRATAALVNGISVEDVTADQRRIAKTVNFGLLYGMQAFGLSRDTGMSRGEAQEFINRYWERLPKVKAFFDDIIEFGKVHGYVQTLAGRRRYLPELNATNGARRQAAARMAMNMPIQGTQADIIKIAMIDLDRELRQRGLPATMVLQVHDELVLEADESRIGDVAKLVKSTMENAFTLDVPVIAEVRAGQNWEDMQPVEVE
ncbi:MAG TPA: DNA polymerase I [Thermomicrobiales bacterium]|nr:DNA polymerase I [Thermomicrobiales bacterium]